MKDTKSIDSEINRHVEEIARLELFKHYIYCIDCKDEYCIYAGTTEDKVCMQHSEWRD